MGKGSDSGSTQTSDPWGPQQAPLNYGFDQARQIYDQGGQQFFPNATYTPFAPQTEQGLGMLQARSQGGSPVDTAAQGWAQNTLGGAPGFSQGYTGAGGPAPGVGGQQLTDTAQGQYLNNNPYLDQTFNRASDALTTRFQEGVQPGINATFGRGGRSGSGIHALTQGKAAGEFGDTLGNLATDIYGGNYQAERGRQVAAGSNLLGDDLSRRGLGANLYGQDLGQQRAAATLAPTLSNLDYRDIDRMFQGGDMTQNQANNVLQDRVNRWDSGQGQDWANLANYIAAIQGNYGGTTEANPNISSGQQAIGGGLTGAVLGNMASDSAWAPWMGALLGAGSTFL